MSLDLVPDNRTVSIAIDTGGTFTDVSLVDRATGEEWKAKVPSTPDDPSRGFIDGVRKALDVAGVAPKRVSHVLHGTTVATNAILEMRGADCALLTTRGFRHVLEIGRHDIPRQANMFSWVKPQRPIPPQRIYEITQRNSFDGGEVTPLNEEEVREAAHHIRARGIRSVAVCYLHAYADAAHERRTRDILLEEEPDLQISLSSEVLPTFREFERSMTTALNAYVMPLVSDYVGRLETGLMREGIEDARLLLVKSNGGVTGAATIRNQPVQTALSGPAAGVIGAQHVGHLAGESRLVTLDIGGTSADICLIDGKEPVITSEGSVGTWPVHVPMIAIQTIGAGGGSIAREANGGLAVGPASAGAVPGPACYGRGGTEPTVTDAHLVLGHLPERLLQGAMGLDKDASIRAVESLARRLGTGLYETASGIIDVVNNNMIGAIRVVSVERGHDPKDFALVPFGGAGPLHGGFIARLLGMKSIIVGPGCGVLSSQGLLIADLRSDFSRTLVLRPPYDNLDQLATLFGELDAQAGDWLRSEGVLPSGSELRRTVSMRYENQGYEIDVPWLEPKVDMAALQAAIGRFHDEHRRLYSFDQTDAPVELAGVRVSAVGRLAKPDFARPAGAAGDARSGEQPIHFQGEKMTCPLYDRTLLAAGSAVSGPAIIEQMDATTFVLPGQQARVDPHGNLIIHEMG
jgi:N-methylhydantoinase A